MQGVPCVATASSYSPVCKPTLVPLCIASVYWEATYIEPKSSLLPIVAVPPEFVPTYFADRYVVLSLYHQSVATVSTGTVVPSQRTLNLLDGSASKKSGSR